MTNIFSPLELESIILDYRKRPYEGYIMYGFIEGFDHARYVIVFEFCEYCKDTGVLTIIVDKLQTYYYKVREERFLDLRTTKNENMKILQQVG